MQVNIEWDQGNWPKCGKHGLTKEVIEEALSGDVMVMDDPHPAEPRKRVIGKTQEGRYAFIVITLRGNRIRPISARYMREKEVRKYEQDTQPAK